MGKNSLSDEELFRRGRHPKFNNDEFGGLEDSEVLNAAQKATQQKKEKEEIKKQQARSKFELERGFENVVKETAEKALDSLDGLS